MLTSYIAFSFSIFCPNALKHHFRRLTVCMGIQLESMGGYLQLHVSDDQMECDNVVVDQLMDDYSSAAVLNLERLMSLFDSYFFLFSVR